MGRILIPLVKTEQQTDKQSPQVVAPNGSSVHNSAEFIALEIQDWVSILGFFFLFMLQNKGTLVMNCVGCNCYSVSNCYWLTVLQSELEVGCTV